MSFGVMCRLFGFRSRIPEPVHTSLVLEKNSLKVQSHEHKDGWGIAAYTTSPMPQLAHGLGPAHQDPEFERVSNLLSAPTVLAHVRLASVGAVTVRNAHPFVYGRWCFAHNGTINDWGRHQATIEGLIGEPLRKLIKGDTDSERCFLLFVGHLSREHDPAGAVPVDAVAKAIAKTVAQVASITDKTDKKSSMNFMVTDGKLLVASRRQRTLFFSEQQKHHKRGDPPPPPGTKLDQIVIASENLTREDHWHEVPEEELVGVDTELRLHRWTLQSLL